jgi:hypothetical protein
MHSLRPLQLIAFFLLLLLASLTVAQERTFLKVEPLAKGATRYQFTYSYFSTNEEYAPKATPRPGLTSIDEGQLRGLFSASAVDATSFPVQEASLYDRRLNFLYEYGFRENLTLTATLDYRSVSVFYVEGVQRQGFEFPTPRTVAADGFGELWLYARYGFLRPAVGAFPLKLSGVFGLKLPTGDILANIPLGTGIIDYEARLLGELNFRVNKIPAFLFGELGYRLRNGSFQNQTFQKVELGIAASPEVTIRAAFSGVSSIGTFTTLLGADEIPTRDALRPITIIGDERFAQASIGIAANLPRNSFLSFDFIRRLYGSGTFAGNFIVVTLALSR